MRALLFFIHLLSIHYQLTRARVYESESGHVKGLSFLFNFTRMFRGALTRNPEHPRKPFPAKSVAYVTCAKFIHSGARAHELRASDLAMIELKIFFRPPIASLRREKVQETRSIFQRIMNGSALIYRARGSLINENR